MVRHLHERLYLHGVCSNYGETVLFASSSLRSREPDD